MPIAALHDDAELAAILAKWVTDRLAMPGAVVGNLTRPSAGASNETVVAHVEYTGANGNPVTERVVFRIQPDGHQLFLRADTVLEGKVLQAVSSESGVPVPEVLALEPDPGVIGSPFFAMRFVDGRVLPDIPSCHAAGWLLGCSPEERGALWDDALRAMVGVARIPATEALAMLRPAPRGAGRLAELVAATREWFDWAGRGRDLDMLGRAMRYVESEMPEGVEDVLNWGDSRIGNIIFADDGTVAALVDWEMASLGPAEVDLGWWVMMEEFYSYRLGAPPLPGVPDEASQVARWEQLMGRAAQHLDYYKVLAALRFAIVIVRSTDLSVEKGVLPASTTMHTRNPCSQMLSAYLGEPEPELAPEYAVLQARYAAGNA